MSLGILWTMFHNLSERDPLLALVSSVMHKTLDIICPLFHNTMYITNARNNMLYCIMIG